jgi:hypothetical protein
VFIFRELFEVVLRLESVSRLMEAEMQKRIVFVVLLAAVLLSLLSISPVAAKSFPTSKSDTPAGHWDGACLQRAAEHLRWQWRTLIPGYTEWVIATCWRPY